MPTILLASTANGKATAAHRYAAVSSSLGSTLCPTEDCWLLKRLGCISSHPTSLHIPPPGISYWQISLNGSSSLVTVTVFSGLRSGAGRSLEMCISEWAEEAEELRERGMVEKEENEVTEEREVDVFELSALAVGHVLREEACLEVLAAESLAIDHDRKRG